MKVFWLQLHALLPHTIQKWMLGADFNMIEDHMDRRGGRSTSIHGQELAEWERVIFLLKLSYVWNLENFSRDKKSLLFSRSSRRATQIESGTVEDEESWFSPNTEQDLPIEARLDRFYLSE